MRRMGILMPVSAIPSKYGIGTFGKASYEFVDFLQEAGQKLWQILPLGPTGYGDSPYQSFSTFAGNPYFIDLELLIKQELLTEEECEACEFVGHPHYVDYERIYNGRFGLLRKAFARGREAGVEESAEYCSFVQDNSFWLEDYCLFMAVKNHFQGKYYGDWEEGIRLRRPDSMNQYRQLLADEVAFYTFLQYLFSGQWTALKKYANEKGIEIIGDIPIYVAQDSADAWSHPELFQFDEDGQPIGVAGCPPDAFSATGQLWGNPLYDWEYHRTTGYEWWMKRIKHCYKLYDIVRIDHFRGFDEYWFVPYGDETACNGHWEKGPGMELFTTLRKQLGDKEVIAEDLGFLTDSVIQMVKDTGYPGMKILQFAFNDWQDNDYLPHNYPKNCVVYTGTHDNETTLGWLQNLSEENLAFVKEYVGCDGDRDTLWALIRAALSSVADTAMIPMQDYLELGNEARINFPSTFGANWKWRMDARAITPELTKKIYKLAKIYGRL
ncbi:MAG: 4-alpha-glucanotransferase [Lachnospiraceae bacterium]|nr:4-alpha-glucanotransferase [Lachnospiraceae bacterium]